MLRRPPLAGALRWLAVRRALRGRPLGPVRIAGAGSAPRRARPELPETLRARLLAIPAATPRRAPAARHAPIVPRSSADSTLSWLLASPATPLVAAFVLALGLSLAWGNPYQAGAATLGRVRDQAAPAASRIRVGATTFAAAASDLGQTAMTVLPRTGLRASRTVTALLSDRADRND
jgi:hypothetical protein